MEAKSPIKGEDFRKASLEEKAGDLSILKKKMYVSRRIRTMCFVSGRKRRLQTSILPMSFVLWIASIAPTVSYCQRVRGKVVWGTIVPS